MKVWFEPSSRGGQLNRRGFTLVEMLVVVAIITVLIAILLPALNKARDAANQVACQSNLRQLTLTLIMYTNDNQGYFPATKTVGHKQYWAEACFTGLKHLDATATNVGSWTNPRNSDSVFICRTDPKPWAALNYDAEYTSPQYTNIIVATSYGANAYLMPSWAKNKSTGLFEWSNNQISSATDPGGGRKITAAKSPTSVYLLLDWYSIYTSNPDPFPNYIYNWKTSQNNGLKTFIPHRNGINISFVDGHVDWEPGLLKDNSKPSNELQSIARNSDW